MVPELFLCSFFCLFVFFNPSSVCTTAVHSLGRQKLWVTLTALPLTCLATLGLFCNSQQAHRDAHWSLISVVAAEWAAVTSPRTLAVEMGCHQSKEHLRLHPAPSP